jgi:predicted AlkP superfamily phosphohydrolase/phosphomutase
MTHSPAQKAIIVGFDGASMELVSHMVEQGHMPNVGKLMAQGVHREMLGVFPTLTPPGWTTLTTGAWPGTHGVVDFNIRTLGAPLDETTWGINTALCQAEYLWNTAERCGKIPILVKWEMSWPPTINHAISRGIQVEGTGPGVSNHAQIAGYHLFCTRGYRGYSIGGEKDTESVDPSALQEGDMVDWVETRSAQGWRNLPASELPPLEVKLVIRPLARGRGDMQRGQQGTPRPYYGLIVATGGGEGYDRLLVAPERDASRALATLVAGEWSDRWRDAFEIDGEPVEGTVCCKLVRLSPDAQSFELFFPQIWPITGYTHPEDIAQELYDHVGPFLQNPARDAMGLIDDDTYFEVLDWHLDALTGAATYLMEHYDWDLLFTETHASDYGNHFYLRLADPVSGAEPEVQERAYRGLVRTYQAMDRWVGGLMARMDEDTVFAIVSDHGGTPDKYRRVAIEEPLVAAGLLVYRQDEATGRRVVDWSRTRAAPVGLGNVYLNLKGREPTGIVEPDEYERAQRAVIDAILDYRDEATGERPFVLALTRRDAEMLDKWGELIGDVVYALRAEYDGAHGYHMPTSRLGIGAQHAVCILCGPGIVKGVHLEGQVRQVDVAPTISYLLGIDVPRNAEGGVIYEALEDPNWHLAALRRLAEGKGE